MPAFPSKNCKVCTNPFTPTGPAAKYCSGCSLARKREIARRHTQAYRIRNNLVEKPGSGKGGNNSKGDSDSQFLTGICYFKKARKRIKESRRFCERCDKDLLNASRYHWVIHHRDHDRTNNSDENFELLCKRCP